MEESVKFTIAPEHIPSLGDLLPGKKSPISPFMGIPVNSASPVTREILASSGIVDDTGKAPPKVRRTLHALAGTKAYVRVHMAEGPDLFEQVIYHAPDGGPPVSVTTTKDGLRVEDPSPVEKVLDGLRQYMGETMIRSFGFEAELPAHDALVMAAVTDIYRKRFLHSYVVDEALDEAPLTPEAVLSFIGSAPVNSQWLTIMVRGMYQDEIPYSESTVGQTLKGLTKSGILEETAGGFAAGDELLLMAGRLLVLDRILHVESGRVNRSGRVAYVGFSCLQAGVHDFLYVEKEGETVLFQGQSSAYVIELTRQFLTEPDVLEDFAEKVAEEDEEAVQEESSVEQTVLFQAGGLPALTLLIEGGPNAGKTFPVPGKATIGRGSGNSIPLQDTKASRNHVELLCRNDGIWVLRDLGSSNGTFVNQYKIDCPVKVNPGDRIRVGDTVLLLKP